MFQAPSKPRFTEHRPSAHLTGELIRIRVRKATGTETLPSEAFKAAAFADRLQAKVQALFSKQAALMSDPAITPVAAYTEIEKDLEKLKAETDKRGGSVFGELEAARDGAIRGVDTALQPSDPHAAREIRAVLRSLGAQERERFIADLEAEGGEGLKAVVAADRMLSGVDDGRHQTLKRKAAHAFAPDQAREAVVLETALTTSFEVRQAFYTSLAKLEGDIEKHRNGMKVSAQARAGAGDATRILRDEDQGPDAA